jgi:hypothetical protein
MILWYLLIKQKCCQIFIVYIQNSCFVSSYYPGIHMNIVLKVSVKVRVVTPSKRNHEGTRTKKSFLIDGETHEGEART